MIAGYAYLDSGFHFDLVVVPILLLIGIAWYLLYGRA